MAVSLPGGDITNCSPGILLTESARERTDGFRVICKSGHLLALQCEPALNARSTEISTYAGCRRDRIQTLLGRFMHADEAAAPGFAARCPVLPLSFIRRARYLHKGGKCARLISIAGFL
jgi:hypothetical protein